MRPRRLAPLILFGFVLLAPATALAEEMIPDISNDMDFWKTPTVLMGLLPDEDGAAEEPKAAEGPNLPLHTFDGAGGHFTVMSAYLTNPGPEGEVFGKPSFGYIHVSLGHGKQLDSFQVTDTLWRRVEVGYALNTLDVGDLFEDIQNAGMARPTGNTVQLHCFNTRCMLVTEGAFDQGWIPALTAGVHYKYNVDIRDIDKESGGGAARPFRGLGIKHAGGWEYSLMTSKTLICLKRPLALSAGVRYTDAAHVGLLGFTGHKKILPEVAFCYMLTNQFVIAGEFKRKYSQYTHVDGLAEPEDNWWTLDVCYLPTPNLSIAAGIGHFGELLNHTAWPIFGVALKYEF
jgi:hypothetical protein